MRGLCKEEDYEFLGMSEKTTKVTAEGAGALENDWRDKKEDRVRDTEVSKYQKTLLIHYYYTKIYMCMGVSGPPATGEGAARKTETPRNRGEQEGEHTHTHTQTDDLKLYKSVHL